MNKNGVSSMNKKMTMYICMQLLFLSGCDIKGMEIDQHIPENNIYQYSGPEKCFYELHPNGLFSQDGLNMSENQTNKMYHGKLLASNNGFFV